MRDKTPHFRHAVHAVQRNDVEETLNRLGDEGFELVQVLPDPEQPGWFLLFFKTLLR